MTALLTLDPFSADASDLRRAAGVMPADQFAQATRPAKKTTRIFAGIDSLTDGANGNAPATYLKPYADALRARYGDAGQGCIPSVLGPMSAAGFSMNAALTPLGASTKANPIALATPCLRGMYSTGAVNTGGFNYAPQAVDGLAPSNIVWDSVRIYFILRSAGSSFRVKQSNLTDGQGVVVSDADFAVGVPQVMTYYAQAALGGNQTLTVNGVNGDVTWVAVEFLNSALGGVTVSNFGLGGVQTAEWAAMDDTINRAWWRLLRPDVFILKGGMNDRASRSALQYAKDIETVTQRILANGKTKVLLVRCNDANDWATTNQANYDKVLRSIAQSYGCAYLDERDIIGNYAAALAAGYMDGVDGIHPANLGKTTLGNGYAARTML